jgi:ATPase subunit of ABC transporter with duplicated ATPase domains
MDAVSKSFGKTKEIFKDLSLNINRGDKIAVTGPNGIGKSTLLKLMVGGDKNLLDADKKDALSPDKGEVRWGHETSVGYFAQDHHEALGHQAKGFTAFEWLYQFDELATQESIRGILGRLLFSGEAALKPLEALSGGEAARLLMAKLLLLKHNVLILDEPTNHLDIESIEGLIDGLQMFTGTLIFVSHDRHFVDSLANRVLDLLPGEGGTGEVRKACKIEDFGGTYVEYLERGERTKKSS